MADITITAEPRKRIHVDLVGVGYDIVVPKAGFAMAMAQRARSGDDDAALSTLNDINEWMRRAFRDRADEVFARLDDDDDDLDIQHITQLMQKSVEAGSDNPTT